MADNNVAATKPPQAAAKKPDTAQAEPPEQEQEPAWLIADADLFVFNPDAGAAPARAFAPGDRVPADLAAQYGWTGQCHVPDWALPDPRPDAKTAGDAGGKEQ